jgi:hypothetical protein
LKLVSQIMSIILPGFNENSQRPSGGNSATLL